jgi:hypothetical protein
MSCSAHIYVTVKPTKTTSTAAYAAVAERTSIGFSSNHDVTSPKTDTHTVVVISPV